MCKTVSAIEPSKVVPFTPPEQKYLYQPLPPTPPLKSKPEEPPSIQAVSEESKKETGETKCIEDPTPTIPSSEPIARNELIQIQPKSFLKSSFHRRLCFGSYVTSVIGVSAAVVYHLRYELANPNLLPVHILLLLITFKMLYVVRHFRD